MIYTTPSPINQSINPTAKPKLSKRRHKDWPMFRYLILGKRPRCAYCGTTKKVELHHIEPYHEAPERELDPANVIPLCESISNCHLTQGHLGNYMQANPTIKNDCEQYQAKKSDANKIMKERRKRTRVGIKLDSA